MSMLAHIRAEPCRPAFQRYLAHQPAFNQGIEAIIHRRHRNVGHVVLRPDENFFGRRMIAFPQQHSIDVLALPRKTKTARCQPFVQLVVGIALHRSAHDKGNVARIRALSILGIILKSGPPNSLQKRDNCCACGGVGSGQN